MGTGSASGENRAREAAERAINSPLLDDINISGARGVLVNITAGLDLSLGEFAEVGDTIEEYASEDATVVVGTVIDPELSDTLKVTVVATGLGQAEGKPSLSVVDRAPTPAVATDLGQDENYDLPPGRRARVAATSGTGQAAVAADTGGEEYFDIPAFLRRQAD